MIGSFYFLLFWRTCNKCYWLLHSTSSFLPEKPNLMHKLMLSFNLFQITEVQLDFFIAAPLFVKDQLKKVSKIKWLLNDKRVKLLFHG